MAQLFKKRHKHGEDGTEPLDAKDARNQDLSDNTEDVLDEIDRVLETNAEAFVNAFVQKGGQ